MPRDKRKTFKETEMRDLIVPEPPEDVARDPTRLQQWQEYWDKQAWWWVDTVEDLRRRGQL